MEKSQKKYYWKKCDYSTDNKYDYNKHCSTAKHLKDNKKIAKIAKIAKKYVCETCGRGFAYPSGLSRHTKNIHPTLDETQEIFIEKNNDVNESNGDKNLKVSNQMFHEMLEQNQYLQQQLIELSKQNRQTFNYNDNKKMTINIFLNEMCKDAMNLTEFIENLQISLDDLMYTKDHGYIKGVSNIFLKHLGYLKPTERPIHCSDRKRLQFYVKDEDKWEKDNNEKIDKTINKVSQTNQNDKGLGKGTSKLEYNDNETQMYLKMIQEVMGGLNDEEMNKNNESIKKTISNDLI